MIRALVIAAGGSVSTSVLEDLGDADLVIAADGGLDTAMNLGLPVDLLIGDLDSVSDTALEAAQSAGIDTRVYSPDKDASDLELALDAAVERGAETVVVLGGQGGRLDHLLANAELLARPDYADLELQWLGNDAIVVICHGHTDLHSEIGATVSLIAVGGPATGVTTQGLRWQLEGDTLEAGTTRGISNEFVRPVANVTLDTGTLLAVMPVAAEETTP